MYFAVPLGFHDDVANLDDAVLGESVAASSCWQLPIKRGGKPRRKHEKALPTRV